jgi:hypothetical protein
VVFFFFFSHFLFLSFEYLYYSWLSFRFLFFIFIYNIYLPFKKTLVRQSLRNLDLLDVGTTSNGKSTIFVWSSLFKSFFISSILLSERDKWKKINHGSYY